jgi:hypothetical protein
MFQVEHEALNGVTADLVPTRSFAHSEVPVDWLKFL